MSRTRVFQLTAIVLILALVAGVMISSSYYLHLPEHLSQHETIVLGASHFVPGSRAALRVVVRDSKDGTPLENAEIAVALRPSQGGRTITLFEGETDAQGTTDVAFVLPEDIEPDQTLIVRTKSKLDSDSVERPVTVARDFRVLLTTDKPIYQPGQLIHVRVLALGAFDLLPANQQPLEVVIADGKGNKLFRRGITTSEYGIAAVDFQLAAEAGSGEYKISAALGNTSSEKTVTVEHYVLPKFDMHFETEKAYYLPGEHVSGVLSVNYFFGKPVAESAVLLEGYVFDVERVTMLSLQGTTDLEGKFTFDFDLPTYIAGSDLEGGLGRFYLQASITDEAAHTEIKNYSLPVSGSALIIEAMPESGRFRPGVENILYVLTSYPDGSPAVTELTINFYDRNETMQATTGDYGIAEIRRTPGDSWQGFSIEARDELGNTGWREFYFEGEPFEETVLLRPDKPIYRVGDTMNLSLYTTQQQGTVYLDIVREGQTISTRSVAVRGGQAEVAVDITPDLFGTLELHAYKILSSGSITRDTRLVVVDQVDDLNVILDLDKEVYRPGDTALLDMTVLGQDGAGVQSALGLAVVDEAVFALAQQDPGFARLYFMLEQQILQPRYELHGFSVPELVSGVPVSSEPMISAIEDAARASLAAAAPAGAPFALEANSRQENQQHALKLQNRFFNGLSTGLFVLYIGFSLGIAIMGIYTAVHHKVLGRSLLLGLGVLVALFVFLLLISVLMTPYGYSGRGYSLLDRFSGLLSFISYNSQILVIILVLVGIAGFVTLVVYAAVKKDSLLGWMLGLLILLLAALSGAMIAGSKGSITPANFILLFAVLAFLLVALAFFLLFSSFVIRKKALPALAAFPLVFFLLLGVLPVMGMGMFAAQSPSVNMQAAGMDMAEALQPVEMAMPTQAPAAAEVKEQAAESERMDETGKPAAQAPRLRQYFPETMLWLPEVLTDASGAAELQIPVADSITTWRMTALASSQDGRLGSVTTPLRVFQDFFIDLDLPLSLTVGDEVSVPIGVFNYLPEVQTVRLELQLADWFEILDEQVKVIDIAANDISVVYFRIRALDFGFQPFQVTAMGSSMSDAILKEVHVYPDGKQIFFTYSDRITPEQAVSQSLLIPADAIAGTQSLSVKIYPGVVSQIVEGLDSLLRMPNGCFEQTSSTTYPNILVMDYLQATGLVSPEVQMQAEEYINLGYQRLVTFEVNGSGGFSLFGDEPADPMLTAYGLQEFNDMSRVHPVDPAIIERIVRWLSASQDADGSWAGVAGFHETGLTSMVERLPVTAYVVWGLADAGYAQEQSAQRGAEYLREFQSQAEDPYALALVANALVAMDMAGGNELTSATQAVLERLAGLEVLEDGTAFWKNQSETAMGSYGSAGTLETTALAALALLRSGEHADLANAALTFLVKSKDSFGTWETTQATVMSLKAFLQSVRGGAEKVNAEVTVTLNGGQTRSVQVTPENFDVVQYLTFEDINIGRENVVSIQISGEGDLMYQAAGSYYLPWGKLALYPEASAQELVTIEVGYDRTELAVNDSVEVTVNVSLNEQGGIAESAIVDLGLPPGFTVQAEDLAALVTYYNDVPEDYAYPVIQRYELTGRQIIIYISNLSQAFPMHFSYRLLAKFPLVVQTPASSAYDYYNPSVSGEQEPQTLVVKE